MHELSAQYSFTAKNVALIETYPFCNLPKHIAAPARELTSTTRPQKSTTITRQTGPDTLFTCFQQLRGVDIEKRTWKIQSQKLDLIQTLRAADNKHIFRGDEKVAPLSTVEANIVGDAHISVATFFVLCRAFHVPAFTFIYKDRFWWKFGETERDTEINPEGDTERDAESKIICYKQSRTCFCVYEEWLPQKWNEFIDGNVAVKAGETFAKPLKAVSKYTLGELRELYTRVMVGNEGTTTAKTKSEMYTALRDYFAPLMWTAKNMTA